MKTYRRGDSEKAPKREPPKNKRGDSADYALSEHQAEAVLKACDDLNDRIIIKCLMFLGLRVSELCHMTSNWITQDGNFRIPSTQKCNCAECARSRKGEWRPKTKAGARLLPVPERLRKDLSDLLKAQPYGLDLSRVGVWFRIKSILKRANIKFKGPTGKPRTGFPHCMRATCATMLAASGMDEIALCYYMGWSDINMAKHYVQIARVKDLAFRQAKEVFG